jgi:hypothetical protein
MELEKVGVISAEVASTGGFLWLVFRLLVGSAMASAITDIRLLKEQADRMEVTQQHTTEKLDNLMLALAERHT